MALMSMALVLPWSAAAQAGSTVSKSAGSELCTVATVFSHLQDIKRSPDCRAGCAGTGRCPPDWVPGAKDRCSAECGRIFEPFWDQCGSILTSVQMGGMKQMSTFYDGCLQSLYPPGSCGKYCSDHTYDCFTREVQAACCDEAGLNCPAQSLVPKACAVGCALVYPRFVDTCRQFIRARAGSATTKYDAFRQKCLQVDAIPLINYALDMQRRGCQINFGGNDGSTGRRIMQSSLSSMFESNSHTCTWDQLDDYARAVDAVCCGPTGIKCGRGEAPSTCPPGCAMAFHQFVTECQATLAVVFAEGDPRRNTLAQFQSRCLKSVDPLFFLHAIQNSTCPADGR